MPPKAPPEVERASDGAATANRGRSERPSGRAGAGRHERRRRSTPPGASARRTAVTVSAQGFAPKTTTSCGWGPVNPRLELPLQLQPSLRTAALPGARPRDRRPLEANIVVSPLGGAGQVIEHKAGADGRFELELAPGRYEVDVKLYGWRKQKKTVEIEDESVTLIDAALHARSRRSDEHPPPRHRSHRDCRADHSVHLALG